MSFAFSENEKIFTKKLDDFQKSFSRFGVTSQDKKKISIEQMRLLLTEAEAQVYPIHIKLKGQVHGNRVQYGYRNSKASITIKSRYPPPYSKIRKYKQEFQDSRKRFSDMENSFLDHQSKQNVLQQGPTQGKIQIGSGQAQMIQNNQKLMGQNYQLQEMNQVGDETEQAAIHISSALYAQKKAMLEAIDDTDEIQRDLGLTNRQITLMRNKEIFNKIILVAVVGVLTLGNLSLIYYRMF